MSCNPDCRKANGRQAHCASCHKTFSGITAFDDHRVAGKCEAIDGFTEVDGIWRDNRRGPRPSYWETR